MKLPLTRRSILGGAAALAACGPTFELEGPFPLGVASGEASPTGAILWTFYRGGQSVRVKVWDDDEAAKVRFEGDAPIGEGDVIHVDAVGLGAFSWHRFQFTDESGAQSPVGRFRTALAPGAIQALTFGACCCTKENFDLAALTHAGGRGDLDAFLLLGDTVYCDGSDTVADFRSMWRSGLVDPGHRNLRKSTSLISTWDDHELFNNWDADSVPKEQVAAALQVYFEHLPTRSGPAGRTIWRSIRWGDTVEVFVLDCRGERWPPDHRYLSIAQMEWLKNGLNQSSAVFKLILNSVPISDFPGAFFATGIEDRWQGFPAQRKEILSFIDDQNLRGILWLSGDFHLACIGRVALEGPGTHQIEALVGPGGQAANPSPSYPAPPQFDWSSGINNYTTISMDPSTLEVRLKYIDGRGRVIQDRSYTL